MSNNQYTPQRPEHLLNVFVKSWFSPNGRGGNGTWRSGYMAYVLSFLLSAQNIRHEVVTGTCQGKGEPQPHVWVRVEQDEFESENDRFAVFDPAEEQFVKVNDETPLVYIADTVLKTAPFTPLTFGPADGPAISLFNVLKTEGGPVRFNLFIDDTHPPLLFTMNDQDALKFLDSIYFVMGGEKKEPVIASAAPQVDPLRAAVINAYTEYKRYAKYSADSDLPGEWAGEARQKAKSALEAYERAVRAYFGLETPLKEVA